MPHNTKVDYLCAPDQREFDISVPFLSRDHVMAKVNGVSTPFQWVSDSRLRLDIQPAANSVVTIQRVTPIDDALVTFHNGSNLTEEELNTAVRQALYRLQEQDDTVNGSLEQARIRLGNSLGVVTEPEAIADEMLRISELGEDLLNRFRDALALVDVSAEEIVTQATALTDQAFRTDVLSNTVSQVGARTNTLETNLNTLTGVVDGLVNFEGEGITAVIENESQARIDGDNALAQTLALIGARNGTNTAFILNLDTARVSATESLASRLSAITARANTNEARIIAEEVTRANAVATEASRINGLLTRMGAAESSIISEAVTRANADSATASQITSLTARMGTAEGNITNEATVRAAADSTFTQTIALMGARNSGNTGFILDLSKVLVTPTESLGSRFSTIAATADANASSIAQALVTTEATARANADNALTTTLNTQASQIAANQSAIAAEATTRANADAAEASARLALTANVANNAAAILSEATTRANADAAEAAARQALAVIVGQNTSAIEQEATARANADSAETTARLALAANVAQVHAGVLNEATTRATADTALAQTIALLGATNGSGTAFIMDLNTIQVGGGVTMGTRLSGIDTQIGNNAAAIVSEQSARVTANSAVTSWLTTLNSTVGTNSASITSLQSVTDGLSARVGVVTDVNGYLTGWLMNNNGASGSFDILADSFSIRAPGSGSRTEYRSGIWYVYDPASSTRTMYGKTFGGSDALVWWTGPSSVSEGSETKANAYVYISTVAPRFGGTDVPTGGTPAGSGAKPLVGAAASTIASATVTSVVSGSLIEMSATFSVPALTADAAMYGQIIFEEGTGGTWTTLASVDVVVGSTGLINPDGSYYGETVGCEGGGFGSRTGSVTYRARFERTGGSSLSGGGYQMSGTLKVTSPA